jgi:4-hydroxy-4-methyl-2-oxoglutarate aldolase
VTHNIVVRNIERADPETIQALQEAGVATVHEAAGQGPLLDPGIRPVQTRSRVAGSAVTVSCAAGDNMMIHAAVEVVQPGDVLVVAPTSPSNHGMFGELLATSLAARGCRGLVIEAGVRDVAELRQMGFPVWSLAVHAQGTVKETPGSVNIPITIGGVEVAPGDVVVADDDGVAIVRRKDAGEVAEAARRRIEKEIETRKRLENGELGVDFYGLREKLEGLGVEWVDQPPGSG